MTERLYYRDAYLTAFDARVVERADEGRRVYLDRTAFYPTSGGQPHDTGHIAGVPVLDVIDEGERIAHVLADAVPEGTVHGDVDWQRRFDHMQQHTGQHLLSAIFADQHGHQTVSVHFGADSSTLDLDGGPAPDERCREVESRANAVVLELRPVTVSFEDAATASGLRKASERGGALRVITIDGLDRSACGGTHVRSTGEIGVVLIRQQERIRNTTRVTFVCGLRAVRRARRDFDLLDAAGRTLSASIDEVPQLVAGQSAQVKDLEARLRRSEGALASYRARERYDAIPATGGRRVCMERSATGSPNDWRAFALAYSALPGAVFIAATDQPAAILLAAAGDAGVDAGKRLKALVEGEGGRGGGSPLMAQGSLPSVVALARVVTRLLAELGG